ncbi:glycosyltransferase family 9 protein [soil metagenome]
MTAHGRPVLLVLRALGLGDLLTGVPALRALAQAFPDHRRVLAAPRALAPLARSSGAIDAVHDSHGLDPLRTGAAPDVAVNLHGRGPQSHRLLLAAAARRVIAFAHPDVPEVAGPRWRQGEHEVARWCRLLEESGIAADRTRVDLPAPQRSVPARARGATLIHPGAKSPARRWPADRWAEVAAARVAAGHDVVVTGGGDELELARAVARGAGLDPTAVHAGGTDVVGLAALVAAAGHVVCGDTGVAHLATALGTPSVVLFGPSSPQEWGPPPERPQHRVLWAGATGDPHADSVDAGLLAITVDEVLAALEQDPARPFAAATRGGTR